MASACESDTLRHAVAAAGREPAVALQSLINDAKVKLLAFGENHWWNNPHRHLLSASMPLLARHGFTHLALELEPHYVDVMITRWQAFTGGTAKLAGSGETFAERARAAGGQ